ncbi:MAG: hypothetical protein SPK00_10385 [Corynebacterium glucuronolyticum]|nr:hypothetical protein [Corynebacterium glucuronolyticum]MDD7587566.1 hypothetical protein [Mycobacteriaceae bacterium]MDY5835132.1 hypothetical protein [Corynebacterium glucuronolyticum]
MDPIVLLDRFDAVIAALLASGGTWLASRESRQTNLRATLDSTAQETIDRLGASIDRLDAQVAELQRKMGIYDSYAAYAVTELRRAEEYMEEHGLHWPPPPYMSFYAWFNEQDKMN